MTKSLYKAFAIFALLASSFLLNAQKMLTTCDGLGIVEIVPDTFLDFDEASNTYTVDCETNFSFTSNGLGADVLMTHPNPGLVIAIYDGQPTTTDPTSDPNSLSFAVPDPATNLLLIDNGSFDLSFLGAQTVTLVPIIIPNVSSFLIGPICSGIDLTENYPTIILQCTDCTVGDSCDDVENGVYNENCVCVSGEVMECTTVGDDCDDENADTDNDVINEDCICVGEVILDCVVGETCDDMDDDTENDALDENCTCVGSPIIVDGCDIVIVEEQFICDQDSGDFSFVWSISGGAPEGDPTETYTITGTGFNTLDVFFGETVTNNYSDGTEVNISVVDSNGCMATWTSDGPIACSKECEEEIVVEQISSICSTDSTAVIVEFVLSGGDPESNPDGIYVVSGAVFDTFENDGSPFSIVFETGAFAELSVTDNEGCEMSYTSDAILNCGADFDCPNQNANIGDDCIDINGETSSLADNCTCPPAPDCSDPIVVETDFVCLGDSGVFTYTWTVSGGDSGGEYIASGTGFNNVPFTSPLSMTFPDGTPVNITFTDGLDCEEFFTSDGPVPCNAFDCDNLGANFGDSCEDDNGNESTVNTDCECELLPELDCPQLGANFGDSCEDDNGNESTVNTDCECELLPELDCPQLGANFGDSCEDDNGNESTINTDCECELLQVFDCPLIGADIGDSCDDGSDNTFDDEINANCQCAGTSICTGSEIFINELQDCDESTGTFTIFVTFGGGIPSVDPTATYTLSGDIAGAFTEAQGATGITVVVGNGESFSLSVTDGTDCQASLDIGTVNCVKLAVELTEFYGEIRESSNLLYWTTATETDNDYFVLERSNNGTNFEAVGVIPGQINSVVETNYEFEDEQPFVGQNFYRLRAVDVFGLSEFSTVILLDRTDREEVVDIGVYPNPVNDILIVESPEADAKITIYQSDGRLIFRSLATHGSQVIDLSHLPAGLFYLKVVGNTFDYTDRIIKK